MTLRANMGTALALCALAGCGSSESQRFVGQPQTRDGPYAVGQNVRVVSPHGDLTVRAGSTGSRIEARFTPFVDAAASSDDAEQAMAEGLSFAVDPSGSTIVVSVGIAADGAGGLGADIAVALPLGLNGGVELRQSDGAIDADLLAGTPSYTTVQSAVGPVDVRGAAGQLGVTVGSGDCSLAAQAWSASDGSVDASAGNLSFAVGAGLSGNIDALAGDAQSGQVLAPSPLPAGWTETVTADNHKSYAFGPNAAQMGTVSLRTTAGASTITITQQ
jgi:hypothetical protein